MVKMKKRASLMLALAMTVTALPYNAMAEETAENMTLKTFNATMKVITVDFNNVTTAISAEGLEDKIAITEHKADGSEVAVTDFTVDITAAMTGTDSSGAELTTAEGNSIIITPAAGIDTTSLYKVEFAPTITDADATSLATGTTTGWFKVNELFSDDFEAEGKYVKDGETTYPYYWDSSNTYLLSKYWNYSNVSRVHIGDKTTKNSYENYSVMRFVAESNISISNEAIPADERVADYTVEYKYQYPGYANNGSLYTSMRANESGTNYDIWSGYRVQLRNNTATSANPTAPITLYAGTTKLISQDYTPADTTGLVNVRMSAVGDNIQYYIDNNKIFDITSTAYRNAGMTGFWENNSTTWWNPSYIDDVSVTSVTKLGDIPQKVEIVSYNADSDTVYLELGDIDLKSNPIEETTLGGIKLYDKDGAEMQRNVSLDGKFIIVKPQEDFEINQKYTVEVKGITTQYGTVLSDYTKSFKLIQEYKETFDENIDGFNVQNIGSWDNTTKPGDAMMKLEGTSVWVDCIFPNTKTFENMDYTTEFDMYVYDADKFNGLCVYSNKTPGSSYNWMNDGSLQCEFGTTRNLDISVSNTVDGHDASHKIYNGAKSSNFDFSQSGVTYKIKIVKKNGIGSFYVNGEKEASFDYSEYAPLQKGILGFRVGSNTVVGIDNILCTYAADYVDDGEGEENPEIAITKADFSTPDDTGKVSAEISVLDNTYAQNTYTVTAAIYDKNDRLISAKSILEENAVKGEEKGYSLEFENASDMSYAKVFIWDSLGTMKSIGTMRQITGINSITYYVNPSADLMSADGTAEHPYKNINSAIERIYDDVSSGAFGVNFTVNVGAGDIFLDDTVTINDYNSLLSTSGTTITIQGRGTDKTFVKSGSAIAEGDIEKVKDQNILSRVPSEARDYIYSVDLSDKGYIGDKSENIELVLNGKVQTAARYPNSGYLKTGEVTADKMSFVCSDERVNAWQTAEDMYVYYMPHYFSYAYKAKALNGLITTENNGGFLTDREYYVYNLLEELDSADEYFYDKTNGRLYFYSKDITGSKYEIFNMNKSLIELVCCDNVKIKDMTIENSGETLVYLRYTKNSGLENCVLRNSSKSALTVSDSYNSGALNCEIYDMGEGGVSLSGGDRNTLAKGKNYVNKCSIHDCQRLNRTYTALVSMSGVGNMCINSDIYNSYHMAIAIYGNDLEVKNNKIYNVCTQTTDMGAVYAEGDYTLRGTVIEHNLFENIPAKGDLGAFAIYLDNGLSGVTVKNNIFKNVQRQAVYVNGGRDNKVINNIFVDSGSIGAISDIFNWGKDSSGNTYSYENPAPARTTLVNKLNAVDYKNEPYTKYEHLSNILEDKPSIPKYNEFSGNVCVNAGGLSTAWLRNTSLETLVSDGGCEYLVYSCSESDLMDYDGGDYTLSDSKASELGFDKFDNVFGR